MYNIRQIHTGGATPMKAPKKPLPAKAILLVSSLILAICLAGLLTLDPFLAGHPQKIEQTLSDGTSCSAQYYTGHREAAFLMMVPDGDCSHKLLLRDLLAQDFPVLCVESVAHPDQDAARQSHLLEQASHLLEQHSGILSDAQVWIGIHSGANTLIDQMMLGTTAEKAALLLSPELGSERIDDAIIVNGNYQSQSEWIQSLSPDMVRQPILLLTSNRDDVATPYQMTLMYNRFSSDDIIHMGGVYHADRNNVWLSITDSGYHATLPFHTQTLSEIVSFLNRISEEPWIAKSALPQLQNGLLVGLCLSLLTELTVGARVAEGFAPQVTYSLPDALKLEHPSRLLGMLALSWLPALVVLPIGWVLFHRFPTKLGYLLFLCFLAFALSRRIFTQLFFHRGLSVFQAGSVSPKALLSAVLIAAASFAALLVLVTRITHVPFFPFSWPLGISVLLALSLFSRELLTVWELLSISSPLSIRAGAVLLFALPTALLLLLCSIFAGSSAMLWSLCFAGILTVHFLVSRCCFSLSGRRELSNLLGLLAVCPAIPYLISLA